MILNVSFEKTISLEIEVPDDIPTDNVDALVAAIIASDDASYVDGYLDDQPVIGYQIDDANGNVLHRDLIFGL